MAATYYLVSGGTGNYASSTNWASSSGGTGGAGVPGSTDTAICDSNSGNQNLTLSTVCNLAVLSCTGTYAGTWTITSALESFGNITLTSGMVITGSGQLIINSACTLTTNGSIIGCIFLVENVVTLAANTTISGLFEMVTVNAKVNGFTLFLNGGATCSSTGALGTTILYFQGTGTIQSTGTQQFSNPITINTSGTITIGTSFAVGVGLTFTYIAGTVITTGSTLWFNYNSSGTVTFNSAGITWNNIGLWSTTNISLSSTLTYTGTLTYANAGINYTFSGSAGIVGNALSCTVVPSSIVFQAGNTYTFNSITLTGASGSLIPFKSSSTSTKAIITLNSGGTQNITYVAAQYIDSSGGLKIINKHGTLSNTINWSNGLSTIIALFMQQ